MSDDPKSFSVLKDWITTFKRQQGRDPLFEDFPADIGLEWKRWKAHKTKAGTGSVPTYSVGTHGAVLPAWSHAGLCHRHHQPGSRSGLHGQTNPFSRGPIKRQQDCKPGRSQSDAKSKTGFYGAKPPGDQAALQNVHARSINEGAAASPASPLKEISMNKQQPVKGFSQIAAQKQQLGLLHKQPGSRGTQATSPPNQAGSLGQHHMDADLSQSEHQEGRDQSGQQQPRRETQTDLTNAGPVSSVSSLAAGLQLTAPEGALSDQSAGMQSVTIQSACVNSSAWLAQHNQSAKDRIGDAVQMPHTMERGTSAQAPTDKSTAVGIVSTAAAKCTTVVARGSKKRRQPEPDSPPESPRSASARNHPQRSHVSRAVFGEGRHGRKLRQPAQQAQHAQQAQRAQHAQHDQAAASEHTMVRQHSHWSANGTAMSRASNTVGMIPRGHSRPAVSKAGKAGSAAARARSAMQPDADVSRTGAACSAGKAAGTMSAPQGDEDALPQQQQQGLRRQQPSRKCAAAKADAVSSVSDDDNDDDQSCDFEGSDNGSDDESLATSYVSGDSDCDSPHHTAGRARNTQLQPWQGHVTILAGDADQHEDRDVHKSAGHDKVAACDRRTDVTESVEQQSDCSDEGSQGEESCRAKPTGKRQRAKAAKPRSTQGGQEGGPRGIGRGAAGVRPGGSKSQAGKKRSQRSDTRQNFVRTNLKGGKGKKFMSKAGARGRTRKPSTKFGRRRTKFLGQAGDGADYLEGYKDPYHVCFKCGRAGHWAQSCPGLLPDGQEVPAGSDTEQQPKAPKPSSRVQPPISSNLHLSQGQQPFVPLPLEGLTDEALAELLSSAFGHGGFRGQQLQVVRRVLDSKSTLAVLPTGSGKSLCYQLPALLLGGTSLVVSPLIALMRDQLARLPACLPAAMLWGGQSKQEALQVLDHLKAGRLRVLYVAPERLHSAMLLEALTPLMPLPLVCVDEAHCVAEWGHNFRSAYFRLGHMLEQNVQCRCVLALTATATKSTEADVTQVLKIDAQNVVRDSNVRDNLRLSITHLNGGSAGGASKRAALKLLQQEPLCSVASVIVYCTFQSQADEVAQYLYAQGIRAASYHAGKPFQEREQIQNSFCAGKVKVVVATVAFGMGVDARGVRGVLHLTLPRSLEEYVQQIGRAGRDGSESYCHLFLDDADFLRLRALAHSDGIQASNALAFLQAVFQERQTFPAQSEAGIEAEYGTLQVARVSEECDMKEEVMETLLSYLEADIDPLVQVLPNTGVSITVLFYNTPPQQLADKHPIVRALLAVCPKERRGCRTAATEDLMNAAAMPATQALKALQVLAAASELRFEVAKQTALAFLVKQRPPQLQALAEAISKRHGVVTAQQAQRLDVAYRSFAAAAAAAGVNTATGSSSADAGTEASRSPVEQCLRSQISAYFESEQELNLDGLPALPIKSSSSTLRMDIRALMAWTRRNKPGCELTGRAVARILQGVSSPAFPMAQWNKSGFWQIYTNVDFAVIATAAQQELDRAQQAPDYDAD